MNFSRTLIELARYSEAVRALEGAAQVGAADVTNSDVEVDELMGRALFELKRCFLCSGRAEVRDLKGRNLSFTAFDPSTVIRVRFGAGVVTP